MNYYFGGKFKKKTYFQILSKKRKFVVQLVSLTKTTALCAKLMLRTFVEIFRVIYSQKNKNFFQILWKLT